MEPLALAKLGAGAVIALRSISASARRGNSPYVVPGILLAGIAVTHLVLALTGTTLAEARAAGWMFKAPAAVGLTPTWDFDDLSQFPWQVLPSLAGDLFAVMFVTAVSTLLNTTGIEFVTKREADLQRELTTIGAANLTAAALGGYVSTISLSRTTLNYAAGGRGRLSGLTTAAVSALMLLVDPGFLAYVPKFVLGGLLLYLGGALIYAWLIQSARRLSPTRIHLPPRHRACSSSRSGFIAGVFIGVIIGCATFAVSASRVNAIKFSFDGSEYRSTLDREPSELAILAAHGREIQGMSLQSYLFFGSANRLYQQVKSLFAARPDCRFLLFDFRLVTGIDSSAMHSFTQIKQAADELGARLVLVNLSPELRSEVQLPHLEGRECRRRSRPGLGGLREGGDLAHSRERGDGRGLREWFTEALGNADYAEQLIACCERLEVRQDEIIASQGEPADCMHFILEGRVGIIVAVRRRTLGPRAQPRTAHHHRRDGADHPAVAQRHHPGGGGQRALCPQRRGL